MFKKNGFYDVVENELSFEKSIKLYRYELYCEDEPQDAGFLVGIEDLGLSFEEEDRLLTPFDKELVNPIHPGMRSSVSFFTETGINKFRDAIQDVLEAYEDSIFDIKEITIELPLEMLDKVIYKDEHQVCLSIELYKSDMEICKDIHEPEFIKEFIPMSIENKESLDNRIKRTMADKYYRSVHGMEKDFIR